MEKKYIKTTSDIKEQFKFKETNKKHLKNQVIISWQRRPKNQIKNR